MANEPSSDMRAFKLRDDFIELNKLLKIENLVASGGEAKHAIGNGLVLVDGEVESRVRRKLVPGNVVRFGDTLIEIASSQ